MQAIEEVLLGFNLRFIPRAISCSLLVRARSPYEILPPEEAWRLSQRVEIPHTPVHGSWLHMAEIELSVLARQALHGRIPTLAAVQERVAAWQEHRNQKQASISWRFTTADARIKLKRLYPSIEA